MIGIFSSKQKTHRFNMMLLANAIFLIFHDNEVNLFLFLKYKKNKNSEFKLVVNLENDGPHQAIFTKDTLHE